MPLTLSAPVTHPFSIQSGIAFARGSVTSLNHLRLEDSSGKPAPAQFAGLARWPDGSYKSVLVSTNVDRPPSPTSYVLRSGPGISPVVLDKPLAVVQSDEAITVTTGPIRFQVNKKRFTFFDQVWVDENHDGHFDVSEAVLSHPGDIFFINAADKAEYRASNDAQARVSLEESGPLKVVIAARGRLQSDRGGALTDYVVRLTAYAGQEFVSADYTLVDSREEKNVEAKRDHPALEATGYGVRLPFNVGLPATGLFGGDRRQNFVAYGGVLAPQQYLYQNGDFNYVNGELKPFDFYYKGVGEGERADGWADVSNPRLGITAMVRKFWQQFPKELAIENQTLTVYLHPPQAVADQESAPAGLVEEAGRYTRPKTFYFPREGGAKTYQLLFSFHWGPADPYAIRALYETFDASPRLVASPGWSCRSGVFGQISESDNWSGNYDALLINGIYQRSVEAGETYGSLAVLYGWRDYGDRLRPGWAGEYNGVKIPGFYNDTHVGAHNFFIQYLRTGDERWYDLGEAATRHWMDIDVSHANRLGYWKHGYGPGEGHLSKHEMPDHDDRNLHKGHAHLSGLPDYYLLTGDRRALEVIYEVGNWWANAVDDLYPVPIEQPHMAEAERDFAWPLFVLNEAYRATGDVKYLKAAAHIVTHLIQWWQTPSDHWVSGKKVGRNDWKQGTGWWAMYPRQDNSPSPPKGQVLYNGTNPWMAGPLLSAIIQFREYDQDTHLLDGALIDEMLLQTMNYVVKYGWRPVGSYFLYSEATESGGAMSHLLYPLVYLSRRYRAGGLAHPEWYDTAPQWEEIAKAAFNSWQAKQANESTDQGFYGYEMVFPADFFTVLESLESPSAVPGNASP